MRHVDWNKQFDRLTEVDQSVSEEARPYLRKAIETMSEDASDKVYRRLRHFIVREGKRGATNVDVMTALAFLVNEMVKDMGRSFGKEVGSPEKGQRISEELWDAIRRMLGKTVEITDDVGAEAVDAFLDGSKGDA